MSIALQDVLKIAHLARLELGDDELKSLTKDLTTIIDYVRQLQAVDTHDVKPFAHAVDLKNVFRDDVLQESLSQDAALANAPARQGDFYRVPGVFES
jgi:aspartyl-tRNA(Asn)/glutamyl-tRNA(Gln) amidotransferase subunit C